MQKFSTPNSDNSNSNNSDNSVSLFAPLSGIIIPIEQVPDPVFSQKIVGDGLAIDPTDQTLVAPCSGKIIQLHSAYHALTLETDWGFQILLHLGLDTVKLRGEGFTPQVKVGERVARGQALITFDADLIAQKAKSLISILVIPETPGMHLTLFPHLSKTQTMTNIKAKANQDILIQVDFSDQIFKSAQNTSNARASTTETVHVSAFFSIKLPSGLHARPAALFASKAKSFQSHIKLKKNEKTANAKSVVSLLSLEVLATDSLQIIAEGPDASTAVTELSEFLIQLEEQEEKEVKVVRQENIGLRIQTTDDNLITGISASPGLAIGRVHQLRNEVFDIPEIAKSSSSSSSEKGQLTKALSQATADLDNLRQQVAQRTDAAQAAIFSAHQEILEDPELIEQTHNLIEQGKSAAFAWDHTIQVHALRLSHLNNELMANRANDLRDVGQRVLRLILGIPGIGTKTQHSQYSKFNTEVILIAENLTPSDTVQLDQAKVLGLCTVMGGATSHVAILARSLGLPALVGVESRVQLIPEGTEIILNGDQGVIRLKPTEDEKQAVRTKQAQIQEKKRIALLKSKEKAATLDGHFIEVAANIGGVADAKMAVEMGCDGVGLLRSEFLFLERSTAPSEEEQFLVYQEIANILGPRPLIIRTLDVGGDKPLQYLPLPHEENPFLGIRGIRAGLLMVPDLLRAQIRAILRVRVPPMGKLHIMFPMISMIEEFREAKKILEEERRKLEAPPVQVGIMVEVPSAALIADALAQEVDFFSIGTNDLTQYTLAMDRGHQQLAKRIDALHPSVLKLIEMTVQAAHRHGKWVGVCGGLASEPKAISLLLKMGVDELSVSIPAIPLVKAQIRSTSLEKAQDLVTEVLMSSTAQEVREIASQTLI